MVFPSTSKMPGGNNKKINFNYANPGISENLKETKPNWETIQEKNFKNKHNSASSI